MTGVLLLNATYEPLTVLSLRRAAKLLLKERAEAIGADTVPLVGLEHSLAIPTVLRLRYYVNVPRRNPPAWTRRGLLARDHYTCAYCGKQCSAREATVDHVLPVSRGGVRRGATPSQPAFAVISARRIARRTRQA